jgi:predicted DNA-binding transcriptional regulator AlpA
MIDETLNYKESGELEIGNGFGRFLRAKELAKYLSCGQSTIWGLRTHDENFPKPIKLTTGITVWDTKEIDNYVLSKARKEK